MKTQISRIMLVALFALMSYRAMNCISKNYKSLQSEYYRNAKGKTHYFINTLFQ